ncbi:MAG: DUF397 domain-containing protein [Candidatus Limnocylindria bacterium]
MSGIGAPGELNWHKSSFSGGAENCVEVAKTADGSWWLQDSKDRTRRPHYFTAAAWEAFIAGVKDGQFD